jgi:hypothetical protein
MTVGVRVKQVALDGDAAKKLLSDKKVVNASKAQLNEAEWAGVLIAMLLFCFSRSIEASIWATCCCLGQVVYFWGRLAFGAKAAPLGALPRYIGIVGLAYAMFGALW